MLSASRRQPHLHHVSAVDPPSNLVSGQELTMCDIVWISLQSHNSLSVKPHFLWHALQWPGLSENDSAATSDAGEDQNREVGLWDLPLKWN